MQWLSIGPLSGQFITLEPLERQHIYELQQAVADGEPWKLWFANVPHPDALAQYVEEAIEGAAKGNIAYAVRLRSDAGNLGPLVGSSRFYNVDAPNRRAMLGYTWYSAAVRRSPVNTECKLLMLKHLFETHGALAVEFRTHFFNQASRSAIERLGAKQDGILRNHQILRDGSIRDTVIYSIIAGEWPTVRNNLMSKLAP
jgi:N-acetyltransferase